MAVRRIARESGGDLPHSKMSARRHSRFGYRLLAAADI
jgi:hypothetical protein